jgi:hypothetical protein
MKKSKLHQIIKEEIQKILNENEFESFLNSLNVKIDQPQKLDRGIDIGSDVAVIKHGQGVITDIDDENQKYTVKIHKGEVKVPFNFVQPIKIVNEDFKLLEKIKELEKEHKNYLKNFISNLADFESSKYEEDFKDERWKLTNIAEFYLKIGQQMWDMFKQNYEYITHSDEFEDLFFDILGLLKILYKVDRGMNENLENVVLAYEKIGEKIGAGIRTM